MHATDPLFAPAAHDHIAAIRADLRAALAGGTFAIVGSALLPQKCARAIIEAGGKLACFIEYDARFWGRSVLGVPVVGPEEARALCPQDTCVIVGIWSPHHRYADSQAWMKAFGFMRVYPVAGLFWVLGDQIGPHYQLAGPDVLLAGQDAIRTVYDALADDESRRQFLAHLRWRLSLDAGAIVKPDRHRVYFDPSIFQLPETAVIADCGAFDGDSLRSCLYWTGGRFGAFHAFEPDPISFGKLKTYVGALQPAVAARIHPTQAALGAERGVIHIAGTGMPGSQQSAAQTSTEVACLKLDDVFAGTRVDYLKLDIEGAEWDALAGARRIIAQDKPVIATAIYHKPDDVFALPHALMAQTPGYRYFMRTHDDDGIDLVFYAVPEAHAGRAP